MSEAELGPLDFLAQRIEIKTDERLPMGTFYLMSSTAQSVLWDTRTGEQWFWPRDWDRGEPQGFWMPSWRPIQGWAWKSADPDVAACMEHLVPAEVFHDVVLRRLLRGTSGPGGEHFMPQARRAGKSRHWAASMRWWMATEEERYPEVYALVRKHCDLVSFPQVKDVESLFMLHPRDYRMLRAIYPPHTRQPWLWVYPPMQPRPISCGCFLASRVNNDPNGCYCECDDERDKTCNHYRHNWGWTFNMPQAWRRTQNDVLIEGDINRVYKATHILLTPTQVRQMRESHPDWLDQFRNIFPSS